MLGEVVSAQMAKCFRQHTVLATTSKMYRVEAQGSVCADMQHGYMVCRFTIDDGNVFPLDAKVRGMAAV